MAKKTVRDVNVSGKKVLVRVDFNVPLDKEGRVTDDTRIKAAMPTIKYLAGEKARVILMSHLGRPKGQVNESYRLDAVAVRLEQLLGAPVRKVDDCIGEQVRQAVDELGEGEVLLLENLRFYPGEEKNEPGFARQLASLGDILVNDAFGTAHRAHASNYGVAQLLPAVAGFLMEKEITMLSQVLGSPGRPFVAIMGGAKVSDKIGVIDNLLTKVDVLLIGGGMANTFFKAGGLDIGKSLLESDKVELAGQLMQKAEEKRVQLLLPVDVVVAPAVSPDADARAVPVNAVPEGGMILDIGPQTVQQFSDRLKNAATVVWNGPLGVFEMEPFAHGTMGIARALADSQAVTVIGGGDSAAAVEKAGVAGRITHISTGGGASLKFLEGKELPGVAALQDK
ncbi:phosphoglycerate kinase [Desulfoscipio sp. XC116]|uniref:phosphoglycerate kinase n=1 Tax=Desulfoscipio sp. XC116 TaxID=3144975 RepID=UPI00325C0E7D